MGVIQNYTAPAPVNPYAKDVDALIDAGEGAAYELIATDKEGKRGSAANERVKFQNAAREAGYTAKVTENETFEDGSLRFVFILVPKRSRTVKPKDEAKAEKPAK